MKSVFSGLFLVFLSLGCVSDMQAVETGDRISVEYTGMLEDDTIFDSSRGRAPLEFKAGAGEMIKGFDAAVIGMVLNEEKNITIQPEDAYGLADPERIIEVPKANVPEGTETGDTLYSGGLPVRAVEVRNNTVIIDTNHPLAGKTLIFNIKILQIEKANSRD